MATLNSPTEELIKWIAEFETTHPVLGDPKMGVFVQYKQGTGKPQYVLFDRDMTVLYKGTGAVDHAEAQELILDMLGAE